VLTGSCVLGADGEPALRLSAGDCFLMSGYRWFQVADEHATPLDDGQRIFQAAGTRIVRLGAPGADADPTLLLGASVHFLDPTVAALLAGLPLLTAIRAGTGPARAIQPLLRLILEEADRVRIGAPVMIERLAEMLFLQAVRALVEEPAGAMPYGWLGALGDARIGGSLVLMHRQPAREASCGSDHRKPPPRSWSAERGSVLSGTGPLLVGGAGAVPELELRAVGGVALHDVHASVGGDVDEVA